ncbi:MAG: carboxylate-amine ligase [Anaerolineales bacterium]|uniref:Putative glutamate--cysteine ligase 2 n=1 Tax=Candidatus Desulfolinea nitratireducens TaxID=2841698 RepID=A0A8J6NKC3_9CHLR|nr:carboxylate-amine ligase [Candidatus Desulfolinea nitratireducens]
MYGIPLTLGIEEEYQIIHPETRDLHSYVQKLLEEGKLIFPEEELKPEFMQSQIEVGSQVCRNVREIREEVIRLRRMVRLLAEKNGMKIAAASTHPFASWLVQDVNAGERYREVLDRMKGVAERLLIFGMHIHIGFGDGTVNKDRMIEIMNQLRYFLPHILALTTSSPFWQGRNTGLKSYRSVVFEMLPRTGIPPHFESFSEYESLVDTLGKVGSAKDFKGKADATKIWWDVRPHPKFGTLEVRVSDVCTSIDDAVAITALIQALVAKLLLLRKNNMSWRRYRQHHINENKWRAMRYGIHGKLIDFGIKEEVPMNFLALEMLDFVDEVVDDLDSRKEIEHIKTILERGTSADRQIQVYEKAISEGASEAEALIKVVDFLTTETMRGV